MADSTPSVAPAAPARRGRSSKQADPSLASAPAATTKAPPKAAKSQVKTTHQNPPAKVTAISKPAASKHGAEKAPAKPRKSKKAPDEPVADTGADSTVNVSSNLVLLGTPAPEVLPARRNRAAVHNTGHDADDEELSHRSDASEDDEEDRTFIPADAPGELAPADALYERTAPPPSDDEEQPPNPPAARATSAPASPERRSQARSAGKRCRTPESRAVEEGPNKTVAREGTVSPVHTRPLPNRIRRRNAFILDIPSVEVISESTPPPDVNSLGYQTEEDSDAEACISTPRDRGRRREGAIPNAKRASINFYKEKWKVPLQQAREAYKDELMRAGYFPDQNARLAAAKACWNQVAYDYAMAHGAKIFIHLSYDIVSLMSVMGSQVRGHFKDAAKPTVPLGYGLSSGNAVEAAGGPSNKEVIAAMIKKLTDNDAFLCAPTWIHPSDKKEFTKVKFTHPVLEDVIFTALYSRTDDKVLRALDGVPDHVMVLAATAVLFVLHDYQNPDSKGGKFTEEQYLAHYNRIKLRLDNTRKGYTDGSGKRHPPQVHRLNYILQEIHRNSMAKLVPVPVATQVVEVHSDGDDYEDVPINPLGV